MPLRSLPGVSAFSARPLSWLRTRARWRAMGALLAVGSVAAPAAAQGGSTPLSERQGFYVGADMLIGGLGAAFHASQDGQPIVAAFRTGALAGLVTYGGQRLIGTTTPALRFAGLQTVALGANLARNAGQGVPLLSDLTFPLFPLYVRVQPQAEQKVTLRLSAAATHALIVYATTPGLESRLSWRESVVSGTPVFLSPHSYLYPDGPGAPGCFESPCGGAQTTLGYTLEGVVVLANGAPSHDNDEYRHLLTHEMGHAAQAVRGDILFALPLSDAITYKIGGPVWLLGQFVVFDFLDPVKGANALSRRFAAPGGGDSYYERETEAMMGRNYCQRYENGLCRW